MSTDKEFSGLPCDLQQYLIELQLRERIRELHSQFWSRMGDLSLRELDLLQQAYIIGLEDGIHASLSAESDEIRIIKQTEPEKRTMIIDKTLQVVLTEYNALDRTLDRLIALIGSMFQDQDEPAMKVYRSRMNEILYDLQSKISDHRRQN